MKKILSLLSSIVIIGSAGASVVSCANVVSQQTTSEETSKIMNVITEYGDKYPFELEKEYSDNASITSYNVQYALNSKLEKKIGFDRNKFLLSPTGFSPIKKDGQHFDDGVFKFKIINRYTQVPLVDSVGKTEFTIYFSTYYTDTLNEMSNDFAKNSSGKSIQLGLTTTPIIDVLNVFASFIGAAVPDFFNSISTISGFTLADLLSVFSSDATMLNRLMSLAPSQIPPLTKKNGVVSIDGDSVMGKQWNIFYGALDQMVTNLANAYFNPKIKYKSMADIKFEGSETSGKLVISPFNLKDIIIATAPDLIHFINFYKKDLEVNLITGKCDIGWMVLRYSVLRSSASLNDYDYNDGFDKINMIKKSSHNAGDDYARIDVSNFDNFAYDLFGYNSAKDLSKSPDIAWIDATDKTLAMKPPVSIKIEKPKDGSTLQQSKDETMDYIYVPSITASNDGEESWFVPTINFSNLAIAVLNGSINSIDMNQPITLNNKSDGIFGNYDGTHGWDWVIQKVTGYDVNKMVYPANIWNQIMKGWADISYYDKSILDFRFKPGQNDAKKMIFIEYKKVGEDSFTRISDFKDMVYSVNKNDVASWRFSADLDGYVQCVDDKGAAIKGLTLDFNDQHFDVYLR